MADGRRWLTTLRPAIVFTMRRLSRAFGALGRSPFVRLDGIEVERDLVYAEPEGVRLHLDVWRPPKPRGAVMYVHGGGFRVLSKDTHWALALMFARGGHIVVNVDYRLATSHPFPAGMTDVMRAYLWVLDHARELDIDTSRLAVAGESAGANLATGVTIASCFERPESWARDVFERGVIPRAVLCASGMMQVTQPERVKERWPHVSPVAHHQITDIGRMYLRETSRLPPETLDFADPLLLLEGPARPVRSLPPFFITCGTRDPLLEDSRRLHRALARRASPTELHVYPDEIHAFHAAVVTRAAQQCWHDTYRFLDDL